MSLRYLFGSSVGKKLWVGITGLGLSGFVLTHMAANMLILFNAEAYNKYSHSLITNPFIYVAEGGLLAMFLVHIYLAASLARGNRVARGAAPQAPAGCAKAARFGSKSMIYTGALTFVFVVLHLWAFKFGTHYSVVYNGVEMRDLHRLVIEKFQQPLFSAWYLFALAVLGVHLSHGFSAIFQTLGIGSVRNGGLKKLGWAFATIIAAGFISQPLYVLFGGR